MESETFEPIFDIADALGPGSRDVLEDLLLEGAVADEPIDDRRAGSGPVVVRRMTTSSTWISTWT